MLACQAAEESISYLAQIARFRPQLSRPWPQIEFLPENELARRMVISVQDIGDDDLTPMAAVAGTIADAVADRLFGQGATRVIIDNGGDIAVRLAEDETATVGIRPQVNSRLISHLIQLDAGRPAWGVATSGVGGRSFTRGIASAVTVLAANSAVADAAATAIANACFVKDDGIRQLPATNIDPQSDLADIKVTTAVGPLHPEKLGLAINSARRKADRLCQKSTIIGAFIVLGNAYDVTEGLKPYVSAVCENSG